MDPFPLTITSCLQRAAAAFPYRPALSSGSLHLTHSHLHDLIESAASSLVSIGITHGATVALAFPNNVELVVALLAVMRARAVAMPLNPSYTVEEFEFYLRDSDSRLLLEHGNKSAVSAASKIGIPHAAVSLSSSSMTFSIAPSIGPVTLGNNEPSDVALFLHTSGTTSRPKGVLLTQSNLAASVSNIASVYKLTENDSTVLVLPLFHVHGLMAALLSSLASGGSVTLPASGRFSASTFWKDMKACGATWYTAVPTIHQILLEQHRRLPESPYPKLRFIRSCSASLAQSILTRMETVFDAPVLEAYAMTEAAHQMTSNPLPENGPRVIGSVGKPVGIEIAILDENGAVQCAGVKGEVCIKGSNVTRGYKNNDDANESAFRYGWFHTGDIGYLDSDGYLYLAGRIKELINRGGEKISPIEVDAVMLSHPDVARAVAFGVPDEIYGEEINCAVILKEGSIITEGDLTSFCKESLANFKVPKRFYIRDSLPMTATGKILRTAVAATFADYALK